MWLMCFNPHTHRDRATVTEVLSLWKVTFSASKTVTVWLRNFMDDWNLLSMENPFSGFFSPSTAAIEETGFCFVLSLLLWPNSALKRFMAVTYTHSYSFVSIETLSPLQACIWELHKPLTVIRNTHRGGYFHLTGSLFLGLIFNNCRKLQRQVIYFYF